MKEPPAQLLARLEDLETRVAFQDDAIERLDAVVARQDRDLQRATERLRALEERLRDLAEAQPGAAEPGGHEVPPHY